MADETGETRGCSCGMADYGQPGHDGESELAGEWGNNPGMWAVTVVLRYQYGNPCESGSTGEWAGLSQTGGSHTLPTFYLNPNVQGILSEPHAKSIVLGMVGTILEAAGAIGWQADWPVDLRLKDRLLTPEITAVWVESDGLGGPDHIG